MELCTKFYTWFAYIKQVQQILGELWLQEHVVENWAGLTDVEFRSQISPVCSQAQFQAILTYTHQRIII